MIKLRKRKWNSQYCATLRQGNLHKVAAPYFCFMYIVQPYKEDWGILRMLGCRTIALPNTKQIVQFFSCGQIYDMNMAENDKEAVAFPIVCHLVARDLHKVVAPYFLRYFF